ncbi:hypothetical protein HELRODRAFT_184782, partial [Helobdella robusta]
YVNTTSGADDNINNNINNGSKSSSSSNNNNINNNINNNNNHNNNNDYPDFGYVNFVNDEDGESHFCFECNRTFKRAIYLRRHVTREHWTTAKLFKCDICAYETKHQSNLLVHRRTHTG